MDFVNLNVGKFTNADSRQLLRPYSATGGEKLSDEDVEAYLEKTVQLFSYLIDKDLFAELRINLPNAS